MVTRLDVGGHIVPIYPTRRGLVVGMESYRNEPLVMLLNSAAAEGTSLAQAVERAEAGSDDLVWVEPTPGAVGKATIRAVGHDHEIVVPWADLRAAVGELHRLQVAWVPPPGPWLFKSDPASPVTTPDEDDALRALDAEIRAVDTLDAEAAVGAEPPSLIERRRLLLRRADELALFDPSPFGGEYGDAKDNSLQALRADSALALRRAGLELRRLGVVDNGASVLAAPVTLDFVRLRLWPPGDDASVWIPPATALLAPDAAGDQGVVLERVGSSAVRMYWRRDGDRPAVLAVAQGPG